MPLMHLLRLSLTNRQGLHQSIQAATAWPALALVGLAGAVHPQTMKAPDITRIPTLDVVPYAHLDTQWRWNFPQTISEYLLKTMRVNFVSLCLSPGRIRNSNLHNHSSTH
jgi:hypothetical protein